MRLFHTLKNYDFIFCVSNEIIAKPNWESIVKRNISIINVGKLVKRSIVWYDINKIIYAKKNHLFLKTWR